MIYWDVVIFRLGLQLLIMIINLSFFFKTFMSSAAIVLKNKCFNFFRNDSTTELQARLKLYLDLRH